MDKYQNAKIYKLVNDIDNDFYVGSTCNPLWSRFSQHKVDARRKPTGKVHALMNQHGYGHFQIILIENYPCQSRNDLNAREDHWIRELKPQLNMYNAILNVTKTKKSDAKYRQKNKSVRLTKQKEYYHQNRIEILAKMSIKHDCEICGGKYTTNNKYKHIKTKKHINSVQN